MQNVNKSHNREQVDLKETLRVIGQYKWLVLFITLIALFASTVYLYFVPSVYKAHSIIEVKNYDRSRASDDLLQNAFYVTNTEIEKEIEILKTFRINNEVLNIIDFKSQIFIDDQYKKVEQYGDESLIQIHNIEIFDKTIVGKKIKLTPNKNTFSLKVEKPKSSFFKKESLNLDSNQTYAFGEIVKTKYFSLTINKSVHYLSKPIYFVVNGNNYSIFEKIVSKKLSVKQLNKNAPLILISYEDTIPKRAASYVNSLVDIFLRKGLERKNERNNKISQFIEHQLVNTKQKLTESENQLKNFQVDNEIISKSTQSNTIISKLYDLDFQVSENKLKYKMVRSLLNMLQKERNFESVGLPLFELGDNITGQYIQTLQKLKLEENKLSMKYTNEYPELISVRSQIASLEQEIFSNIKNLHNSIKKKINGLTEIKEEYEKKLLALPEKDINLIKLTRTHEVNSKMYEYLLRKKSENDMIKVATVSDYEVIEKAYPNKESIKPNRSLFLLSSLIVGFIFGSILAFLLNSLRNKVDILKDVRSSVSLPIYSMIPSIKTSNKKKIFVFENPHSLFSYSYRKLRTDLQFLNQEQNIILVTSMLSGEGKTTTIVNLAAILQLSGYKVLVVDLAFRNAEVSKYFDVDYNLGISDYLTQKTEVGDIVYNTLHPNLDIVPAGSPSVNPSELTLSPKVKEMLEKFRESYDYILIDSESMVLYTDTLNLIKYSDINLVVFNASKTNKKYLNYLEQIVDKYKIKNLGIIFNSVDPKRLKNNVTI